MYREHKKTACRYCGKLCDVASIARHEKACTDPNSKLNQKKNRLSHMHELPDSLLCKHCGRLCKNLNSLAQHELRCKQNPDRRCYDHLTKYILENVKGHTAEEVPHIKRQAETLRQMYAEGKKQVTLQRYLQDETEYLYREHNQGEIDKWLNYVQTAEVNIPEYTAIGHNEGYKVVSKLYTYEGSSVKVTLEHNFLANLYLQGNLKAENAVHHINRIRDDNRIVNLLVFATKAEHKRFHASKEAFLIYNEETHLFNCILKHNQ